MLGRYCQQKSSMTNPNCVRALLTDNSRHSSPAWRSWDLCTSSIPVEDIHPGIERSSPWPHLSKLCSANGFWIRWLHKSLSCLHPQLVLLVETGLWIVCQGLCTNPMHLLLNRPNQLEAGCPCPAPAALEQSHASLKDCSWPDCTRQLSAELLLGCWSARHTPPSWTSPSRCHRDAQLRLSAMALPSLRCRRSNHDLLLLVPHLSGTAWLCRSWLLSLGIPPTATNLKWKLLRPAFLLGSCVSPLTECRSGRSFLGKRMLRKLQDLLSASFTSSTSSPSCTLKSSATGSLLGRGNFGSCRRGQSGHRKSLTALIAVSGALLILKAFNIAGTLACPRFMCILLMASFNSRGRFCHLASRVCSSAWNRSNSGWSAWWSSPGNLPKRDTHKRRLGAVKGLICDDGAILPHSSQSVDNTLSSGSKRSVFLSGASKGPR